MLGRSVLLCAAAMSGLWAQQWEVGAIGGFGTALDQKATRGVTSIPAGLKSGLAVGAYWNNHSRPKLGGELRYLHRMGDSKLEGTQGMNARSHLIHYDVLWSPQDRRESMPWFYLAVGGGVRVFESTGIESSTQPARTYALLTRATQVAPMASLGVGVRWAISQRIAVRAEVRDYLSTFPSKLIAPAPGAQVSGILNDVIGLVGVGASW